MAEVTTDSEIGPLGITANSFAPVSLDPPLILWSPAKFSRRYTAFAQASHFAIHVIGAEQKELSDGFANGSRATSTVARRSIMHVPVPSPS